MRGVGPRCFSSGSPGWSGEGPCGGGPSPLSRTRMEQGEPLSRKKISLLGPLLLTQLPKSRWGSWGYKERSRVLAGVLRSLWKSRASPRDSQCRENTILTPSPSGGLGCGTAAHTQRGTGSRRSHLETKARACSNFRVSTGIETSRSWSGSFIQAYGHLCRNSNPV